MKPSSVLPKAATAATITRRLAVRHETLYEYDTPVEVAHHSAWLRPRDTAWQRVLEWHMSIQPEPECAVQESLDAFGNWRHGFSHARVHDRLEVVSAFEVDVTAPVAADEAFAGVSWEEAARALRYRAGMQQPEAVAFLLGSHFAPQDERLAAFGLGLFTPDRPLAEVARALMGRVHERMHYKPLSTDVATSALDALAQGQGVCQDFAHLMIGVLRSHGLAARYVSGYLLTQPPPGQPRLVGADASHAWVAVWCPQNGWLALDPTNDVAAGLDHVTLAWGRDYADVAPLRGVIRGGGAALPSVAVSVTEVGDAG
ncbi:MAG: transglutaminase family protein [Ideonella sp.]|jgi:transglutaminase-like putative cysteine protease|nr:transglutaminase family protein [Ideonella sp.]